MPEAQASTQATNQTPSEQLLKEAWEIYTRSWKATTREAKLDLFSQVLDPSCHYRDPTIHTVGWAALADHMLNFHEQIPGGHFVTTTFTAHHLRSMAHWHMCDSSSTKVGEGVSIGEFNEQGKLLSMTGFFETS